MRTGRLPRSSLAVRPWRAGARPPRGGRSRRMRARGEQAAEEPRPEDDAGRRDRRCPDEHESELERAEPGDAPGPRATARGSTRATMASASAVVAIAGSLPSDGAERVEDVRRPFRPREAEVADDHVGERQRAPAETGDGRCGEDADARVEAAPPGARHGLDGERQQREQPECGEERPGAERKPRARVAPGHGEPGEREHAVDDSRRLRDVPEREERRGERERETEPRQAERRRGPRRARAARARGAARTGGGSRRRSSRPPRGPRTGGAGRAESSARSRGVRRSRTRRAGLAAGLAAAGIGAATYASRSSAASRAAAGRLPGSTASAESTTASRRRGSSGRRAESGGAPPAIVEATWGSGTPQKG